MKKADNFNPGKWLVENKITKQSRLNEESLPTTVENDEDFVEVGNILKKNDVIPVNTNRFEVTRAKLHGRGG